MNRGTANRLDECLPGRGRMTGVPQFVWLKTLVVRQRIHETVVDGSQQSSATSKSGTDTTLSLPPRIQS
jgi:hypothetical protein